MTLALPPRQPPFGLRPARALALLRFLAVVASYGFVNAPRQATRRTATRHHGIAPTGSHWDGNDLKCESRLIERSHTLNCQHKLMMLVIDDAHLMAMTTLRKLRLLFEEFPGEPVGERTRDALLPLSGVQQGAATKP